jgi:polysaccharide export outer membrane protein
LFCVAHSQDIVLIPNDKVDVIVYRQSELSLQGIVVPHGTIHYPLIGDIQFTGRTIEEVQKEITARLEKDYLVDPHVTILVKDFAKRMVYLLGSIRRPGSYEIQPSIGLTLYQLISLGEGFEEDADKEKIRIIRPLANDQKNFLTASCKDITNSGGSLSEDISLLPGDIVIVPDLKRRITILGGVKTAGVYQFKPDEQLSLLHAVGRAGGFTGEAQKGKIRVFRLVEGELKIAFETDYDLSESANKEGLKNFALVDGDNITVYGAAEKIYISGEVIKQGNIPYPTGKTMTLMEAISETGGFARFADKSKVEIRRIGPDGKLQIIKVDIKKIEKGKAQDVEIKPGDHIFVPQGGW